MPELPEVATMCMNVQFATRIDELFPLGPGKIIREVQVFRNPGDRYSDAYRVLGSQIKSITRRGKYMLFNVDMVDGKPTENHALVCHNAMSGFWDTQGKPWTFDYVEGKRVSKDSDVRATFTLNDGSVLRFHDARLFGSLKLVKNPLFELSKKVGPEPINTVCCAEPPPFQMDARHLSRLIFNKKPKKNCVIKEFLMDQKVVAGIGNIYAVEALWRARVRPDREVVSLTTSEMDNIAGHIQNVLNTALIYGLDYSKYLKVYRKEECEECHLPIRKIEIAKRSTYFCELCQS